MKRILLALFVTLLCVTPMLGNHGTHYGKVTVGASAGGKVYLSESKVNISSITDDQWSSADIVKTFNCGGNSSGDTKTYYGYAKAESGYLFAGWGTSKTAASFESASESDFVVSCTASGSQSSPTSVAKYAVFQKGSRFYATQTIQAKAKDAGANSNGSGKVFINAANNKTNAVWENSSTTSNTKIADATSAKVTFYAFAIADEGVFYGWYDGTGKFISAANPYTVNVTSTSTNESNPAQGAALYAYFRTTTDTKYAQAIANVQTTANSSGNGLVFTSADNLAWSEVNSEVMAKFAAPCTSVVKNAQEQVYSVSIPFYVYAIPKRGCKLQSWSTSATGAASTSTGWKADGVTNPLTYNISATSTNNSKPTVGKSCFAMFVANSSTCDVKYKKPTNGNIQVQCLDVVSNALVRQDILNTDTISTESTVSHYTSDVAVLTAQPEVGYKVYRWVSYDANGAVANVLAYDQDEYVFVTSAAQTIGVEFIQSNLNFKIKESGQLCSTLQDAIDKATAYVVSNSSATIVPLVDYIVPAGEYTIPAKVTLLIPFDDANTCYTTEPVILHGWRKEDDSGKASTCDDASADRSFVYRTLTLAQGAQLNIEGVVSLSAKHWCVINTGISSGTYNNANPSGSNRIHKGFGLINMENGSSIQVKKDGKLYCWGRIRGEGEITAKSGSEVRESYVYTDWRNNDYFANYTRYTRCFPQNQYYVQEIQVPITYESGATCTLEGALFYSSGTAAQKGTMGFVGAEGSGSFIELPSNATVTKKYVASEDRLYIDLNNGASFNNFKLNYSSWKVATNTHIFTITNNWTVNVNSGTTTVAYDLGWAPGSILNIKQGAAVTMLDGVSMYVYDHDDWGDFAAGRRIQPLQKPKQEASYGVTVKTRTYDVDCPDAEIIVNGTLTVTGGENKVFKSTDSNCSFDNSNKGTYQSGLYTTEGGANIHGTGTVIYANGLGNQTQTQQLNLTTDWNTSTAESNIKYYSYTPISRFGTGMARPVITAAKLNNGSDYTLTSTANATGATTFKYVASTGKWGKVSTVTFKNGETVVKQGSLAEGEAIVQPMATPEKTGYTFNGWGTVLATMGTSNLVYSAQWTPINYTLTFDANGGSDVASITQGYETAITAPANPTRVGYTFAGWNPTLPDKMPLNGGSYTAQWTINQYTISFNANGGSSVDAITQDYLSNVTAPAAPTREGYTFAGWQPAVPTTMPLNGETCVAQWTVNQYTISFNVNGGLEVIASKTQDYGTAIEAPANPTFEGYVFAGWDPALPATMPAENITCVAQWELKIVNIEVKSEETEITKSDGSKEIVTETTYTLGNGETTVQAQSDTVVIEANATLVVKNKVNLDVATAITVGEDATIEVAAEATVKAEALVLNASPSVIDIENDKAGASSQVICDNESAFAAIENVYIDVKMDASGNLDGSKYYAFAVPFKVNVADGVQKIDNKGEVTAAINNTHYRAYTYNGKNRADKGKGSNWDQVTSGTFNPGVFYLVEFADGKYNTFRFQAADKDINNEGKIALTGYGDGDANNPNNGWNGIANNALHSAKISVAGGQAVQVFDPIAKAFIPAELGTTNFSIGTPMMVQVLANDTAINSPVAAPARMLAAQEDNTFGNYTIRIKAEGAAKMADQLFISASENAASEYVIGKDIVKMFMGNATVAQLWVNDYDKKLAMNQAVLTNDMATASLTLYAPKAGSYSVYLKNIPEDATIYLMQNGQSVACLNDGACTVELTKGENTSYSIRIHTHKSPQVTTSMDEIVNSEEVQKVLLDGVVYIVRDGKMYNTLGIER